MQTPRPLAVSEAQERVLARFRRCSAEPTALDPALGRTLAVDLLAASDLPSFTNSAMDGYALRAADTIGASGTTPLMLRVIGMQPAGAVAAPPVGQGEAVAITTGAPLPVGADAVARVEDTDGGAATMAIHRPLLPGTNVRRQGEVVRAGQTLLNAGTRLDPGKIALLAAAGVAQPPVVRRPQVALLSTGDELVPVGQPLRAGQIADANGPMLAALVAQYGGEAIPLGIARDTPDDLRRILSSVGDVALIVTSGGVSVGAHDAVRAVIAAQGALDFWQVRMRPGRPVAFGHIGETPILALPGNPVAAFVAFHLLARPALARMLGQSPEIPQTVRVRLRATLENRGAWQAYLHAAVVATSTGWDVAAVMEQGSGNVATLAAAKALIVIPEGIVNAPAGAMVDALLLNG
jgi:molybdopterin molybdotransferase